MINSNYAEFKIDFEECLNEGFESFDSCPRYMQERMARNYWLSFDKPERMKFLEYIEESIMDAAVNAEKPMTQEHIEDSLIDFYGKQIDEQFKAVTRYAA